MEPRSHQTALEKEYERINKELSSVEEYLQIVKTIQGALTEQNQRKKAGAFISVCSSISSHELLALERFAFPSSECISLLERLLSDKSTRGYNDEVSSLLDEKSEFAITALASRFVSEIQNKGKGEKRFDVNTALILLSDILLFQAFLKLENEAFDRLNYQLNMCIILDAMKYKPDRVDMTSLLTEVSEKTAIAVDIGEEIYWDVAMLNYKTQIYNSAIKFFSRYIELHADITTEFTTVKRLCEEYFITAKEKALDISVLHAFIYIGYCFEKREKKADANKKVDFDAAIGLFKILIGELENRTGMDDLITELHHGLGHFYNERAVFGSAQNKYKSDDLKEARFHLEKAVKAKPDYYSCYGSLFHEYGDFERAEIIFSESAKLEDIKKDDELRYELMFYRGQTFSALDREDEADNQYKRFEDYCNRTHNEDGIAHARIFRIRNDLRKLDLTAQKTNKHLAIQANIKKWQRELKEYALSDYASEEIKKEYVKTRAVIKVFAALYADPTQLWRPEDIFFHLREFVSLMQYEALKLQYIDENRSKSDSRKTDNNLFRIRLGRLWLWCVGGKDQKEFLSQNCSKFLKDIGIPITFNKPVNDIEEARKCILKDGKPDMVVVIPPIEQNPNFERELSRLSVNENEESCFFFVERDDSFYNPVNRMARNLPKMAYNDKVERLLQLAFCMRALEVLRKQLLQPIPLFSLAPTHFSAAYDFQLGESLDCKIGPLKPVYEKSSNNPDKMKHFFQNVDKKYNSSWKGRDKVKFTTEKFRVDTVPCAKGSSFVAFYTGPETSPQQQNDYICYSISDVKAFKNCNSSLTYGPLCGIESSKVYSTKALPEYAFAFNELKSFLRQCNACENVNSDGDDCFPLCYCFNSDDPQKEPIVQKCCTILLSSIFGKEYKLKDPFRCILREMYEGETTNTYIYIVVFPTKQAFDDAMDPAVGADNNILIDENTDDDSNTSKLEGEKVMSSDMANTKEKTQGILTENDAESQNEKCSETTTVPKTQKNIRILHLSDLHFKSDAKKTASEIRKEYLDSLLNELEKAGQEKIDYICFTGDIAHCGKKEDYLGAESIIREIMAKVNIKPDHLLICPGNHDQYLETFYDKYPTTQIDADEYLRFENLSYLSNSFSAFSSFCEGISCQAYEVIAEERSFLVGIRQLDDLIVTIINTAWLSMDKGGAGKEPSARAAWIGDSFVTAINNRIPKVRNKPVLTLMHHPVNCWAEQEHSSLPGSTNVWKKVTTFSNFILCGHTHEISSNKEIHNNARILHGGCLYENSDKAYPRCFYVYSLPVGENDKLHIEKHQWQDTEWIVTHRDE